MDSNHRRRKPADLQSAPFGRSGTPPNLVSVYVALLNPTLSGAGGGIRTRDLLLTRQLLCQLSYASETTGDSPKKRRVVEARTSRSCVVEPRLVEGRPVIVK